MSQFKFKPHDLSDGRAKLGRRQCRDLFEAKTQAYAEDRETQLEAGQEC